MSPSDAIVTVNAVSKRFCRDLSRSLRYALADIARDLIGRPPVDALRPDEFWAVDGVGFSLAAGDCLGLVGSNGAGKSTLLKLIAGLIKPDRGTVTIAGRVGALIDLNAAMHPLLTGRENIHLAGSILGLSRREIAARADAIVDFAGIEDFINAPVQTYSSGMRVRLGFAIAAHLEPDVLLIDEVLAVGDTAFRMKCFDHILSLRARGTALVLVSHNPIDISRLCTRALLLSGGVVSAEGDPPSVLAAYQAATAAWEPRDQRTVGAAAWIESVHVDHTDGGGPIQISTGDPIEFEIVLRSGHRVERLRIVVHVHGAELGLLGSFASPASGAWWDCDGEIRIRLRLPDIPLLCGVYSISFSLYGPRKGDFLHERIHAVSFRVGGPPVDLFGYGLCHTFRFDHEWETLS